MPEGIAHGRRTGEIPGPNRSAIVRAPGIEGLGAETTRVVSSARQFQTHLTPFPSHRQASGRAANLHRQQAVGPPRSGFVQEPVPERPQRLAVSPRLCRPFGYRLLPLPTTRQSSTGETVLYKRFGPWSPDPPGLCDCGCPSPRPVAPRLETLGRPNGSGLETLAERNADRRPLGACPNICSCSRMAAGFCWSLAFSASAQPCAALSPSIYPDAGRSGARSSKDCGSSISVATRPTLSPGLAIETCGFPGGLDHAEYRLDDVLARCVESFTSRRTQFALHLFFALASAEGAAASAEGAAALGGTGASWCFCRPVAMCGSMPIFSNSSTASLLK